MTRSQTTFHILAATLLLTSLLPMGMAASDPATDSQETKIKEVVAGNSGPKGISALQADWILKNEIQTFFLEQGVVTRYSPGGGCGNSNPRQFHALYDPVTSNAPDPAGSDQTIAFPITELASNYEVAQLSSTLYMQSEQAFRVEVQLLADGQPRGSPANVQMTGFVSTVPNIPIYGSAQAAGQAFTGSITFTPPVAFIAGEDLAVRLTAVPSQTGAVSTLELQYGCSGSPSNVQLIGDMSRISAWTENKDKQFDQTFPAPATSSVADRAITARVAHINAIGDIALRQHPHYIQVVGPDGKVYYDNILASFGPGTPSAVKICPTAAPCAEGITSNQRWGAARDDLSTDVGNQVTGAPGLQMASYSLTYPDSLALQGAYNLKIGAKGQAWEVSLPIVVGGAGSTIELAPLELATKEILVGERTTFRVTVKNTGSGTDTFALNAQPAATPTGWSANVVPAQLTLSPGASADAIVNVIPSAAGRNGDENRIRVTATSFSSGIATDLNVPGETCGPTSAVTCGDLKVLLTSVKTTDVGLTVSSDEVSVGPGGSRQIPVIVENLGNARDNFVLSMQGVPIGWTVSTNPSTFTLEARSQAASIVTVTAPPEAVRGFDFTFTLKVVRANDATKSDSLDIDVSVILANKLSFSLFGGSNPDGTPILIPSTSIDAPQVHLLRDEGPDGKVNAGDPTGVFATSSTAWDANEDWDMDYDQSTIFRLILANDGDNPDSVRVVPKLLTGERQFSPDLATAAQRAALGYQDFDGCEGDDDDNTGGDSFNDGWRFRLFDPSGTTNPTLPAPGSAGRQDYNAVVAQERTITIPPHSVHHLYAEMAWVLPTPWIDSETCGAGGNDSQGDGVGGTRDRDPAPGHAVAIEAISLNDPSQRNTHVLNARVVGRVGGEDSTPAAGNPGPAPSRLSSQRYSDQSNAVALHVDYVDTDPTSVVKMGLDPTSKKVPLSNVVAERTATYSLRAVNMGNEADTLRVSMPQLQNGWEYSFSGITTNANLVAPLLNEGHGKAMRALGCGTPFVQNPTASPSARTLVFECTVGSHDEVPFQVKAVAPAQGTIGSFDALKVTIQSKDSFQSSITKADDILLRTGLTGDYLFNLLPDLSGSAVQASLHPGGTTSVPFTLRNLGTEDDNITLDLPTAPAGSTGWSGDFSLANPVFLPAGREVNGFLLVRAPDTATNTAQQAFRIRAQSEESPLIPKAADFLDLTATVVTNSPLLNLTGKQLNVVAEPNVKETLTVIVERSSQSTATSATLRLDPASIPTGWTHDGLGPKTVTWATGERTKEETFGITPPADVLGSSRAAIRFTAADTNGVSEFTHIGVSLATPTVGVNLTSPQGNTILVAPGASTQIPLEIENLGVNLDTVNLTATSIPQGWNVSYAAREIGVQPLQAKLTDITVTSPKNLAPGQSVLLRLVATTSDKTRSDTLDLNLTTGASLPVLVAKTNGTLAQLPEETFRFVVTVANNGTLGDDLNIATALTGTFKDLVKVKATPEKVSLEPGDAEDVQVEVTLPAGLAPGLDVPVIIEARSQGPFLNSVGTTTVPVKILDHKLRDVDGDRVDEYAVDRDRDTATGYEDYFDPATNGRASQRIDAGSLLNEAARADFTVVTTGADGTSTSVVRFLFDPDADDKADLLIDRESDGKADVYWDPDRGYSHLIPLLKDVTGDGREDYFFDLDGVGNGTRLDVFYDPLAGTTGRLLQIDIDNNGVLDYVVDSNGNGNPDVSETVLFGGPDGEVISIREFADVDGDKKMDTVIDSDGDGNPDYFVPNGKTAGVEIVLEDVDGDGIDDWTFDSDGDGRRDAYYNPVTKESGFLDTQGDFLSQLTKYWYIGALFGVVLALFVVLLLVTRK